MSDKAHITYLFDPLCGWCYGASPLLAQLAALPNLIVTLAPTGLFSGTGTRPVDEQLAAFAWSNDVRIASLTGQRFTEDYHVQVLGGGGMLDSGPATLAVTAVSLTEPSREIDALKLIQEARYASGRNITDLPELRAMLEHAGLKAASDRLATPDAELLAANRKRIERARLLMREFEAGGVPALIVDDGRRRALVKAHEMFGSAADLVARLSAIGSSRPLNIRQNQT
ncbi:DsbA family protein [Agrobacterium sp. Ap1]|uniref:DsbA family protein n=1 Tax=Agrobacterium sp. Ap1 TaxID=2815337 RepID=UPI001A8EC782|nr:DsbA family protein [Agrobacterium sp. Ap1]MBO0145261.1 DsbA family protein [Agrobacterium sp. Ap1]